MSPKSLSPVEDTESDEDNAPLQVPKAISTSTTMDASNIASHVSACLQSFDGLQNRMRNGKDKYLEQLQLSEIADELGRFQIWAGTMGACRGGRSSMDYRLRDASHIKVKAQALLRDLNTFIQRTLEIFRGDRIPWDEQTTPKSEVDVRTTHIESEDESLEGETELRQLLASIHETITFLLRLSAAIQNPAPHDHYMHSRRFSTSQASENSDIGHVQEMFPTAPKTVVDVLGKAISRRREYFIYRAAHNKKPSKAIQEENIHSEPKSSDDDGKPMLSPLSNVASSISHTLKMSDRDLQREAEQLSECDSIHTSLESVGTGGQAAEIPPLPKGAQNGDLFPCPFCFMVISVQSWHSWKLHVLKDLQPYVCTFPSCLSSRRLFERRHEWFQHEIQHHRRVWTCVSGCQACFESREDFEQHLQESHGHSENHEQLTSLVDSCEMGARLDFETNCVLCGDSLKMEHLERHLGKHQENLALFALPDISASEGNELEDPSAYMTTSEAAGSCFQTTASEAPTSNRGGEILANDEIPGSKTSFNEDNISSEYESEGSTKAASSSSHTRIIYDDWSTEPSSMSSGSPPRNHHRSYSRERYDYAPTVGMTREHKKPSPQHRPILRGYQRQPGGYPVDAEGYYENGGYDATEQRRFDPGEDYRRYRAPHPALTDRGHRAYSPPRQYFERPRSSGPMRLRSAGSAFEGPWRRADAMRRLEEEELLEREAAAQADLDLYMRKQRVRTLEAAEGGPRKRNEADATKSTTEEELLERKAAAEKSLANSPSNDVMEQHHIDPGEENRQYHAPNPALVDRGHRAVRLPPAPEVSASEAPLRTEDAMRRLEEEELLEREAAAQADLDFYLRKQRVRGLQALEDDDTRGRRYGRRKDDWW